MSYKTSQYKYKNGYELISKRGKVYADDEEIMELKNNKETYDVEINSTKDVSLSIEYKFQTHHIKVTKLFRKVENSMPFNDAISETVSIKYNIIIMISIWKCYVGHLKAYSTH